MDADRQPSMGPLLDKSTRSDRLVVMSVSGEYVPQLGLLACRCDLDGRPLSALLPDGVTGAWEDVTLHSNPRRVSDDDDGA